LQHLSKSLATCAVCGAKESTPGTFPMVVGVGRVCLSCGMKRVKCDACGQEVKLITSSKFQGRTLCLSDHMKEVEKYKKHIVNTFDEADLKPAAIMEAALHKGPEGYTLLAVRRARNSSHVWEAEYEKSEIFQMRCS
jgi:hypothetical protein